MYIQTGRKKEGEQENWDRVGAQKTLAVQFRFSVPPLANGVAGRPFASPSNEGKTDAQAYVLPATEHQDRLRLDVAFT